MVTVQQDECFVMVPATQSNRVALRCPDCQRITEKRADSFAVGLHFLTCVSCGFGTDAVRLSDGRISSKDANAYR